MDNQTEIANEIIRFGSFYETIKDVDTIVVADELEYCCTFDIMFDIQNKKYENKLVDYYFENKHNAVFWNVTKNMKIFKLYNLITEKLDLFSGNQYFKIMN